MSVSEEINNLLPDNNTRAIEPKHVREALGKVLGSLPTNIAKIDESEGEDKKEGNTYTKDQVNDLLDEKLDKPTANISEPNLEYKYVPIINEQGDTQRMLAGDLRKNIGNSDMTIPPDTVRILDITGAKFQTKGLENKQNDISFNLKLILNANGEWAVTDEPNVTFQMPQNATITVNHLYPPQIPERPSYADAIVDAFERAKHKTWTIWRKSDFELIDNSQPIDNFVTFNENGFMELNAVNLPTGVDKLKLFGVKKFSDTDSFQIRLEIKSFYDFAYHGLNIFTGLGYSALEDVTVSAYTSGYDSFFNLGNGTRNNVTIFFTKIDNIVYVNAYRMQSNFAAVANLNPELGDAIFKVVIAKNCTGNIRISYKDLK